MGFNSGFKGLIYFEGDVMLRKLGDSKLVGQITHKYLYWYLRHCAPIPVRQREAE